MDGEFQLGEFLPYRLSLLANLVSGTLAQRYARRFDLTVNEWRVMAALGEADNRTADQVCRATALDKVSVSRAVARLRRAGRLRRTTARHDRRCANLSLTAAGRRVYQQIVPLAVDYERRLVDALEAEERRHLDTLLATLTERARLLQREAGLEAPAAAQSST